LSKGAARLCIVVLDCAGPARTGTAHEVLTATPSIAAIAGTAFFVNIIMAKPKSAAFGSDMGVPSRSNFLDIAADGLMLLDSYASPAGSVTWMVWAQNLGLPSMYEYFHGAVWQRKKLISPSDNEW
jgi:hypothetical protein